MALEVIAKVSEIAAKGIEKVSEIKEFGNSSEVLQPDIGSIKSQSIESIMQINVEKVEAAAEIEPPEFRPLTENETQTIQELTNMSDATIKDCTINEDGTVNLKCINESKLGETFEIPYVQKTVDVNGIQIQVVVPEFPDGAYECAIPKELYLAGDSEVFANCTEQLKAAIEHNAELAKQFTPQQLEQIVNGAPRISGFTWHHCAECGKMQLVPTKVHSDYRHTGGKAIWGGGRTN